MSKQVLVVIDGYEFLVDNIESANWIYKSNTSLAFVDSTNGYSYMLEHDDQYDYYSVIL